MFLFRPLDDFVIFFCFHGNPTKEAKVIQLVFKEDKFVFHTSFNNIIIIVKMP